ncbi:polymeric immunoglobulin receptor-like [Brachyhypopomus gauderio]|uniref:polymeric immunoglobulin receptor-like n=1 Tax=Brachyhypopomus gauderio TaxID=698409 RepID=UPI004041378E
MTGLKKSDVGWYWCSVVDVQVTDALTVTTVVTMTADNEKTSIKETNPHTTPVSSSENSMDKRITVIWSLMGVGLLLLTVLVFCICMSVRKFNSENMRTLKHIAVKSGDSVTIPCFYDESYKSNKKFWCHGYYWSSCTIVAYGNTHGSTSVIDHPTHNMFTVELNRLNTDHSGWYWCAAEIGDKYNPDDKDYLYLTVSAAPAVSVLGSRVSGEEGSSVSVQCLYSAAYQNKQKQWCRSTDWSCYTVGRTHTSQNSTVWIREGIRSFKVEMSGLKKSDAGWYWCSVGDVQVPVHLTVTDALTVTTTVTMTPESK